MYYLKNSKTSSWRSLFTLNRSMAVNLHQTRAVTKQVSSSEGSAVVIHEPHDWSSSMTRCCEDCKICKLIVNSKMVATHAHELYIAY